MKLIGIGGTNGSGKDTLSEILAADGWLFVSTSRDLIIPELQRRGLPLERENMASLTAEWRKEKGTAVVIDKAVEKFEQESKNHSYKGLVISSLRHPWEAVRLHELGGKLIWVDADPKLRYDRVYNRGQGDKDKKSFEQFVAEEKSEQKHDSDEHALSWQDVKDRADIFIFNDTNNIEDFKAKAMKTIQDILN